MLSELAEQVGAATATNSKTHSRAALFVKIALLVIGAATVAISHTLELALTNEAFGGLTAAGLAGAGLVAVGAIYVYLTEQDASSILEQARQAIEIARQREREMENWEGDRSILNKEVTRGLELYNSMDVMRGAIEQCLDIPEVSTASVLQTCLSAAVNSLVVALDFEIEDTWTICIYQAQPIGESSRVELKCVAHVRKIPCSVDDASAWPEGVGITGVAYSMGNEAVIPDMAAPELGTIFALKTEALKREHDADRYRSMVAVPITLGAGAAVWGVAVVSTDRPHHFTAEPSDGVPHAEPARAIAAMAALAVKAIGRREPRPAPNRQSTEDSAESTMPGSPRMDPEADKN